MGDFKVEKDGKVFFEDFNPMSACRHWLEAKKKGLKCRISCQSEFLAWEIRSILRSEQKPMRLTPAEADALEKAIY